MNRIRQFIFVLLNIGMACTTQAHFYAYQEWYNPVTGQILEEWFDIHETTNPEIDCKGQQAALIERAQKSGNVLVLVEDMISLIAEREGFFNFENKSSENKESMRKLLPNLSVETGNVTEDKDPIAMLYAHCFSNGIPTVNIECRFSTESLEKAHKEIAAYDDGPVLNKFYEIVKIYAGTSKTFFKNAEIDIKEAVAVDACALHAIACNPDKHIMLIAGASHITNINNVLLQLGWQPRSLVLPSTLNYKEKQILENTCITIHPQNIVDWYTFAIYYELRGTQKEREQTKAEYEALLKSDSFSQHAIPVATIPMHPQLCIPPIRTSDRESKEEAVQRTTKVTNPRIIEFAPCFPPQSTAQPALLASLPSTRLQRIIGHVRGHPRYLAMTIGMGIAAVWALKNIQNVQRAAHTLAVPA